MISLLWCGPQARPAISWALPQALSHHCPSSSCSQGRLWAQILCPTPTTRCLAWLQKMAGSARSPPCSHPHRFQEVPRALVFYLLNAQLSFLSRYSFPLPLLSPFSPTCSLSRRPPRHQQSLFYFPFLERLTCLHRALSVT